MDHITKRKQVFSGKTMLSSIRESRTVRGIMLMVLLSIVFEIISPTAALALTSGPSSPEFASFEPVATTDMVNDLTGDFTYNLPVVSIPGPDGGGYSMSLSYHSGSTPEEEASWVGFGWTLNPGAINRNKRGIADDFNGAAVEQFNKIKPNWTQLSASDANLEINSQDEIADKKKLQDIKAEKAGEKAGFKFGGVNGFGAQSTALDQLNLTEENPWAFSPEFNFSNAIRYNNYSGFSVSKSFTNTSFGMASLSLNRSGGETTLGFSVSPLALLSKISRSLAALRKEQAEGTDTGDGSKAQKRKNRSEVFAKLTNNKVAKNLTSMYSVRTYEAPAVPYSVAYNVGRAYNYSISLRLNPPNLPVGFQVGLKGHLNVQANYPLVNSKAYGYMFNKNLADYKGNDNHKKGYDVNLDADATNNMEVILADYQLEKETTFNKHDRNLGIPYNTSDIFSMSGDGAIGGFQIHQTEIGHFFPNFLMNKQKIKQLGLEVGVGGTVSIGFDVGVGFQRTSVGDWDNVTNLVDQDGNDDVKYGFTNDVFMQFNNDLGGELAYTDDDNAFLNATIEGSLFNRQLDISQFGSAKTVLKGQNQRSSNIQYSIFASNGNSLIDRLDPSTELNNYFVRGVDYKELIGQIAVTNKDGNRSVYGIPVFTRNEMELNVGIRFDLASNVTYRKTNPLYTGSDVLKNYTVSGQRIKNPWASTYLLTQNTTFDYVDADAVPGPSKDDFGGWTKFAYRKAVWGTTQNPDHWYKYRAPYTGLFYNRGKLLDEHDQSGSMNSGEKEVFYLKAIETKTHVACFVTNKTQAADFTSYGSFSNDANQFLEGSLDPRKDGKGASKAMTGSQENAASSNSAIGTDRLEKLEKIVLFSKDDLNKPISITYFEYTNELCQGTPNSDTENGGNTNGGKLTLKKVWTEGGGTVKSRISPYKFEYNYFRDYSAKIKSKYNNIESPYLGFAAEAENPNYLPGMTDAWGNYRINGPNRFTRMQPWLDQALDPNHIDNVEDNDYDPAAWQLKRITLPSGGEIHVQYEQKDYAYVMNKKATVMTPLVNNFPTSEDDQNKYGYLSGNNSTYVINHNAIGISNLDSDMRPYAELLDKYFVKGQEKLYFKFLYNLVGTDPPNLTHPTREIEYVSGYTTVNEVVYDDVNNEIRLKLGELKENGDGETEVGKKDRTLPRWVGYQMALTSGGLNLAEHENFRNDTQTDDDLLTNTAYDQTSGELDDEGDELFDEARKLTKANAFDYFGEWLDGGFRKGKRKNFCQIQKYDDSYFKLPVYKSKKGGGCRVKRVLSYDPGMSTNDGTEMVYGTEYIYKLEGSDMSSGVATNEPGAMREENALVGYLERKPQKKLDRLLNGTDSKQFEGPLGEFLLPGAGIAYSRVVMKSIHSGKTTTGYTVNEYHTCKEFPMQVDFTELSKEGNDPTYKKLNLSLPLGMINIDIHKAWVTQGYLFKLNDMHGKVKSQATYSGNYNASTASLQMPTSKTVYDYTKPGESIKSLFYNPVSREFDISITQPGQEEDLTMYRSRVKDITNNFSLEIDLNICLPVAITLGFGISYQYSHNELSQHVTTKVIHQQSFLKSTTSTVDGITQTTENLAYNLHTGEPVLTRTYDGFISENEKMYALKNGAVTTSEHDGHYYALNIPGSWVYNKLGQKSDDPTNSNQLGIMVGNIVTYGKNELYDKIALGAGTYDPDALPFTSVINASAVVLKENWFTTPNAYLAEIENEFTIPNIQATKDQLNSHYYPLRSYVYRDVTVNSHVGGAYYSQIHHGGVIKNPVKMFDWTQTSFSEVHDNFTSEPGDWFSPSQVMAYSPHGAPLAEKDILNIYSTAKFGPDKILPKLVAQNADYKQVEFKDYEHDGDNSAYAHSGSRSYNLRNNISSPVISGYDFTNLSSRGVSMKLWLKSSQNENINSPNYGKSNPDPQLKAVINGNYYTFKRVAKTGDWSLYVLDMSGFNLTGLQNISLSYNFMSGNEMVLIDDVRIQPLDAVMNCTVYSADKKILAQFGDQHFGIYFDYNQEGLLLRQTMETEKGRKIIKEQHKNSPTTPRQE
ncbi:MAG: hypothetical protein K0R65_2766 [Crocinitomicaceae bacterium]|jgi:hypothetical protein|nr:hypothetical protein [Crocinitomicaceae bacterium]